MKKYVSLVLFSLLSWAVCAKDFPKVILAGDYPDPTILRDGKDYYMTHSPFYYAPGLGTLGTGMPCHGAMGRLGHGTGFGEV